MQRNILIIAYDITSDKLRTQLSNFLGTFGTRIQLSVFEVQNSEKVLKKVLKGIEEEFNPLLASTDSIYIFRVDHGETQRYGAADIVDKKAKSGLIIF